MSRDADNGWMDAFGGWVFEYRGRTVYFGGDTAYAPLGSESFADLQARVLPVWERLTSEFRDRTMVVVAHGVICKVLLVSVTEEWKLGDWHKLGPIHNVAISDLERSNAGWNAVAVNALPSEIAEVNNAHETPRY